jgi:carboxypeptidase T
MTPLDGGFDEAVEEVEAIIDTAGLREGRHIVFVRGQDAEGYWGAFSAVFLSIREPAMFHSYLPIVVKDN